LCSAPPPLQTAPEGHLGLVGQVSGSSFDRPQCLFGLQSRGDGRACAVETAYIRGARRSPTRGGLIFLCSIQQSRPTRGRPGHIESYPNPFLTNGKPSRRPAVTAHMPHVPPERPNLHSRSATASERLGFPLVRNGFRMLYVPPTGTRYYRGYPPGQKKLGQFPEGYRASVCRNYIGHNYAGHNYTQCHARSRTHAHSGCIGHNYVWP
jgi:hypothetical protein